MTTIEMRAIRVGFTKDWNGSQRPPAFQPKYRKNFRQKALPRAQRMVLPRRSLSERKIGGDSPRRARSTISRVEGRGSRARSNAEVGTVWCNHKGHREHRGLIWGNYGFT